MDDKPKVGPPLFYADYGVDWARLGADRTVWMTATEAEARQAESLEALAEGLRPLHAIVARLAGIVAAASEPEPTESETALHRAVLATRRKN